MNIKVKLQPCNEQSCKLAALYNTIHCWQHHPDRHQWLDEVESLALSEMPVADANFYEANFSELNLSGLHAVNSNFNSVNFHNCKIHNTELRDSHMMRCRFDTADINASNLTGVNLNCSYGSELIAKDCHFEKSQARHCTFTKSDFSKSDFSHSDWTYANLSGSNLTEIEAENWMAPWINLSDAILKGANCEMAVLGRAQMTKVDASRSNFKRANLNGIIGIYGNFSHARMYYARLTAAKLDFANSEITKTVFRVAELKGANLKGSTKLQSSWDRTRYV